MTGKRTQEVTDLDEVERRTVRLRRVAAGMVVTKQERQERGVDGGGGGDGDNKEIGLDEKEEEEEDGAVEKSTTELAAAKHASNGGLGNNDDNDDDIELEDEDIGEGFVVVVPKASNATGGRVHDVITKAVPAAVFGGLVPSAATQTVSKL